MSNHINNTKFYRQTFTRLFRIEQLDLEISFRIHPYHEMNYKIYSNEMQKKFISRSIFIVFKKILSKNFSEIIFPIIKLNLTHINVFISWNNSIWCIFFQSETRELVIHTIVDNNTIDMSPCPKSCKYSRDHQYS